MSFRLSHWDVTLSLSKCYRIENKESKTLYNRFFNATQILNDSRFLLYLIIKLLIKIVIANLALVRCGNLISQSQKQTDYHDLH